MNVLSLEIIIFILGIAGVLLITMVVILGTRALGISGGASKDGNIKSTKDRMLFAGLVLVGLVNSLLNIVFVFLVLWVIPHWIPGKFAVKEQDFADHAPYIIVQESYYIGTGWEQVGDESGYYPSEDYFDIDIVNYDVLPIMGMYHDDYVNKFICKVEYKGKVEHWAFEDEIDSYYIVEWYPVYPVSRDTLLPNWLYPKNFMSIRELKSY